MSEESFNNKYNAGRQGYEKISNVEKLEKLAALRQNNMITDQEYEQQKEQLLRKM
ncbi:SHOCT domain-containing protein [Larkinella sp. GY13]|uniref:SHOCT domain-containing protein n=1 Tax=Larkinella sp. GY13 TaxID=3453720 RepID=UPI003EED9BF8